MTILHDIRFGLRMLFKNPGFTTVAVMALALGIGANSMMFSIYNGAILKSLPFEKPEQVVHITARDLVEGADRMNVSYPDFIEYRKQARSFKTIAATLDSNFNISDEHTAPERVVGSQITANTFSLIGQRPRLGRDFLPNEDAPEADAVVILSYGLWQTRYAADPSVLGKTLRVNAQPRTIVGVMSEGMEFPEISKIWIPLVLRPPARPNRSGYLDVIGRLSDGVSIPQAETELRLIARDVANDYADNKNVEPVVMSYLDWTLDWEDRQILNTLVGAVAFVLLIACANVANLLLSRAVHRGRETSIRIALGAGRWRIVRQLLVESILMSLVGGALGLVFAVFGVRAFSAAIRPMGIPYWMDFSMDYTSFIYLLGVSVATGIVFGLAPALQTSKTNVNENLKEIGRGSTGGKRSRWLTNALVVVEISLTLVLMVGAGLMVRSLLKRQTLDIGIRPENLVVAGMRLDNSKYPGSEDSLQFEKRLVERLSAVPDLESFTIATHIPAAGTMYSPLTLPDRNIADRDGRPPDVEMIVIAPGYFRALGLTLPRGREFNENDGAPGIEAAIVNQSFVSKFWPGEEPIGKKIKLQNGPWLTVVGISPAIKQFLRDLEAEPRVYQPYRQYPYSPFSIIARSRSSDAVVAKMLREEVQKIDPDLPLYNIRTMQNYLNSTALPTQILSTMFSVFAIIGLVLSSVGIYAVTAYATNRRTQEIGVRMALGAGSRDVLWLVLRLGLKQLAVGLPIGLAAAFAVSRLLAVQLFQVTPLDPMTFVSIPVLLTLITLAACLVPARRAARLNAVEALRME